MRTILDVNGEIQLLADQLLRLQQDDGTWRFCFDNGTSTGVYLIILLRSLEMKEEALIRRLHDRIAAEQQPDGTWRLYPDEKEGNLSATAEAYYALLYSGYSKPADERMHQARRFIREKGGLRNMNALLTKAIMAATGQYPWPAHLMIPLEFLLLPPAFPVSFFGFSGYGRVHLAPMLLLADRRFTLTTAASPDLSDLLADSPEQQHPAPGESRGLDELLQEIQAGLKQLAGLPKHLHQQASRFAEQYMLRRIEPDGTLYSYASCTILMIYALLALGYDKRSPVILRAVQGMVAMICRQGDKWLMQNSPSTVWDTALAGHALQEAGPAAATAPAVRRAADYLLARRQQKLGDWSIHTAHPVPGGWGFSDSNTLNPDVDDTTAALRVIRRMAGNDPTFRDPADRGLNWLLAMQNTDGGWPAFEKGTDNPLFALLPLDGAKAAAVDPSSADLTGRTLEYLGDTEGFTVRHRFIQRGVDWLVAHQEKNGSWYGRWGICYIYGTWAALTGMMAVGVRPDHPSVQRAVAWLLRIQNEDGGWGESCSSDRDMDYVPLGASTPEQTAWALDALTAVHSQPLPALEKGIGRLLALLHKEDWASSYPTGAGLPGTVYIRYHSYRYVWPLLALSHYRKKYGE